ncbi:Calx-beta domain-containing protein [Kribbella sp. NPDC055071]
MLAVVVAAVGLVQAGEFEIASAAPAGTSGFAVDTMEYNLGDLAVELPALNGRSELRGRVYAPRGAAGKRPMVVFLHGFHQYCTGEVQTWPCPAGETAVPSFRGYGAAAEALASHGYVVISVSANAINAGGGKTPDRGATARGELVLAHLDLWRRWSSSADGPFGRRFVGRVDLDNVGLMGHSRGGDGVIAAALANAGRPSPYGIRAVMPLASTDGSRTTLPGVGMSLLMGYCDADVYDLQGQHHFDDSRYAAADNVPRSTVLVMGANHNFWNSEWSAEDDWGHDPDKAPCGSATPGRLTAAEQQSVGRAYIDGFFRLMLGGETALATMFDGSNTLPTSLRPTEVHVVAQMPSSSRLDVARFDHPLPKASISGSLTASTCSGVPMDEGLSRDPRYCVQDPQADLFPHWVPVLLVPRVPNPAVTVLRWDGLDGVVRLRSPRPDVSSYSALTFRAAPDPEAAGSSDLTVRITDQHGHFEEVAVSAVSDALKPLPGAPEDAQPKTLLRTVRIPLSRLRAVDLHAIRTIELRTDRIPHAAVFVSDLAFSRWSPGTTTLPSLPRLSIADAPTIEEGDRGSRTVEFAVTLSRPSSIPVTVHAETSGFFFDPAIVTPVAKELTFAPGQTVRPFSVVVHGNDVAQSDQHFNVALSVPHNAALADAWAAGTVLDDDADQVGTRRHITVGSLRR